MTVLDVGLEVVVDSTTGQETVIATGQHTPVESFWATAWHWRQEGNPNHTAYCPCLACADLRHHLAQNPRWASVMVQ